jgi:hypothetical protein
MFFFFLSKLFPGDLEEKKNPRAHIDMHVMTNEKTTSATDNTPCNACNDSYHDEILKNKKIIVMRTVSTIAVRATRPIDRVKTFVLRRLIEDSFHQWDSCATIR